MTAGLCPLSYTCSGQLAFRLFHRRASHGTSVSCGRATNHPEPQRHRTRSIGFLLTAHRASARLRLGLADLGFPLRAGPGSAPCVPLALFGRGYPRRAVPVMAEGPVGKPRGRAHSKVLVAWSPASLWPKQVTWPCWTPTGCRKGSAHHLGGDGQGENVFCPIISSGTFYKL